MIAPVAEVDAIWNTGTSREYPPDAPPTVAALATLKVSAAAAALTKYVAPVNTPLSPLREENESVLPTPRRFEPTVVTLVVATPSVACADTVASVVSAMGAAAKLVLNVNVTADGVERTT